MKPSRFFILSPKDLSLRRESAKNGLLLDTPKTKKHFTEWTLLVFAVALGLAPVLYADSPAKKTKKKASPTRTATITPTPAFSSKPFTPCPTVTPIATDTFHFDLSSKIEKSLVTVIPNPAWGAKLSFRIMLPKPALVKIRIYNRNLEPFDKIEKDGEKVFDILWSLKKVPEGLYYYQVQIVDDETGKITKLPLQNFAVMK